MQIRKDQRTLCATFSLEFIGIHNLHHNLPGGAVGRFFGDLRYGKMLI